jgi:hypothetical protein
MVANLTAKTWIRECWCSQDETALFLALNNAVCGKMCLPVGSGVSRGLSILDAVAARLGARTVRVLTVQMLVQGVLPVQYVQAQSELLARAIHF